MEPGTKGPPQRIETVADYLDEGLLHESQVLDLLVVAQARGQGHPELWNKLMSAAIRDDRLTELAFAYERVFQDRRVKVMAPANQARIFLHAARFFLRALGDVDGAEGALDRALTLVPGHPEAFEQMHRILEDKGAKAKLAQLHLSVVTPKTEKESALEHLHEALTLLSDLDPPAASKVAAQILRLDPADRVALLAVTSGLESAGKHGELVRTLEHCLAIDPPLPAEERVAIRKRILAVYADKLPDLDKSIPHVEEILASDPTDAEARAVAERLLSSKAVGARAAQALEKVYLAAGDHAGEIKMIGLQIEHLRGGKRIEAQRKLGLSLFEGGDDEGAFSHLEAVLVADPADDDVRVAYATLARKLEKSSEAVKTMIRAASSLKDLTKRGRMNLEVARLMLEIGETKRAKALLQSLLEPADSDIAEDSARALLPHLDDVRSKLPALEILARSSADNGERIAALRELAVIHEGQEGDLKRAADARLRLFELDKSVDPDDLDRILEATSDFEHLALVLESRALELPLSERCELMLRVADLVGEKLGDDARALRILQDIQRDQGPTHALHAQLIPALEKHGDRALLTRALSDELSLPSASTGPELRARLGQLLLEQGELSGALDQFEKVLEQAPTEPRTRAAMLKLVSLDDDVAIQTRAALLIVPILRSESSSSTLVQALEVISDFHVEPSERLSALREAQSLVDAQGRDKLKALLLAGKGLRAAIDSERSSVLDWMGRVTADRGVSKVAVAEALAAPLRDREIEDEVLCRVMERAGDAYVASGDPARAMEAYKRVLSFEPENELVADRIAELLLVRGTLEERVHLCRERLARSTSVERTRQLYLQLIGLYEDKREAALRAREGLVALPDDRVLREELVLLLSAESNYTELYEELRHDAGLDPSSVSVERLAEVAGLAGRSADALAHFRVLFEEPRESWDDSVLSAAQSLAEREGATDVEIRVAELRAAAHEPRRVADVVALARVHELRARDLEVAAKHYQEAGRLAELSGDRSGAIAHLEAAKRCAPDARAIYWDLIELLRKNEQIDAFFVCFGELLLRLPTELDAVALFQQHLDLAAAGHCDRLLALIDGLEVRFPDGQELLRMRAALLSRAGRVVEAGQFLLSRTSPDEADSVALNLLRGLLEENEAESGLLEVRRELLGREVERSRVAGESLLEPLRAVFRFERDLAKDPNRAATILDQMLALEPRDDEALVERYELAYRRGDFVIAVQCLERRLENAESDAARLESALRVARLYYEKLGDLGRALDVIEPCLATHADEPMLRQLAQAALEDSKLQERAVRMLARIAEATLSDEAKDELYSALFEKAKPEAFGELEPRLWRAWLSTLREQPERALRVAARAAVRLPDSTEFWTEAEALAQKTKEPKVLRDAYRQVLSGNAPLSVDAATAQALASSIGERAVTFHEEWFDDQEETIHLLRLVGAQAPSATWAFERLKLLYNAHERWEELFELYDAGIAARTGLDRETLIEDAIEVARDLAGDHERAIAYLALLRQVRKGDTKLDAQLERLYERYGKWAELVELQKTFLAALPPESQRPVRLRMATVLRDELGEEEQALEVIEGLALDADPEAVAFVSGWATFDSTRGPRTVADFTRAVTSTRTIRQKAASLLSRSTSGDAATRGAMLEIALEAPLPVEERLEVLRRLTENYRSLERPFETVTALIAEASLVTDPAEEASVVDALTHTAGADELLLAASVDGLLEAGDRSFDRAKALRLFGQASVLARDVLHDESRALSADLAALARADGDPQAALAAARKLDRDLAQAGRHQDRLVVLEKIAELEGNPLERRACLVEVADLATPKDPRRALAALTRWLSEAPADLELTGRAIELLRGLDDTAALVGYLERRAALSPDVAVSLSDWMESARLHLAAGNEPSAVSAYERALSQLGPTYELVYPLAELLSRASRWTELAVLVAQYEAAFSGRERASLAYLGGQAARQLGEPAEALKKFSEALGDETVGPLAEAGLRELTRDLSDADEDVQSTVFADVVAALSLRYEQTGQLEALLDLVPERAKATRNDLEKCEIYLRAASLEEAQNPDSQRPLVRTVEAFALRPEFPGCAEALLRRVVHSRRWDLVMPHLLPALATRLDIPTGVARELLVGAARAEAGRGVEASAGQIEALLAAAHQRDPSDGSVLLGLIEHRRLRPSPLLVEALLSLSRLRGGSVPLLEEAANVAFRDVGDDDAGLAITEELFGVAADMLRKEPSGVAEDALIWAMNVLEPMLDTRLQGDRVLELLLVVSDLPMDPRRQRAFFFAAAARSVPTAAVALFERLLTRDPTDSGVHDELAKLYLNLGRKLELSKLYGLMASQAPIGEPRSEHFAAAATLMLELGLRTGALQMLKQSVAEFPHHTPSVDLLLRLYLEERDWAPLATLADAEGARRLSDPDPAVKAAGERLVEEATRIFEVELKLPTKAVNAYRRLMLGEPSEAQLSRFSQLLDLAGLHQEEAAVLERLETLTGGSDELSLRLATAYGRGGQVERAQEQLERALREGRSTPRVREVLATIYRSSGNFEALSELLVAEAHGSDDIDFKVERLSAAARVRAEKLSRARDATELLEEALRYKPDELPTLFALAEVQRLGGLETEARATLARVIEQFGARKPKERALVHHELAKLALAAKDRTTALTELDTAAKIDPANAAVLAMLGEVSLLEGQFLRAQRTYRALLLVLRSARAHDTKEAVAVNKTTVLVELAFIAEKQKESDRKAEFVESAFEAAGESSEEFDALAEALERRGYFDLFGRALEKRAELLPPNSTERMTIELELAELFQSRLGRPDDAVRLAQGVLEKAIVSECPGRAGMEERVVALFAGADLLRELVGHLERLGRDVGGGEMLRLFDRAATLAELRLHDDGKAAELLAAISESDLAAPKERQSALRRLERIGERAAGAGGDVVPYIRTLEALLSSYADEATSFEETATAFYRLVGLLLETGESERALSLLETAIPPDGGDPRGERLEVELRRLVHKWPADRRLVRLFEQFARERSRRPALVEALVALADPNRFPGEESGAGYREAWEITTELGDTKLALAILELAAASGADDANWALAALAERRMEDGRAIDACDLWERFASRSEPTDARTVLLRVGGVAREHGDSPRAVRIYQALLEHEPADREVWQPLSELYQAAGDVTALATLMEKTIALVDDVGERAGLRIGVAKLLEASDPSRAAELLDEVVDEDPNNLEAAAMLRDLYEKTGNDDRLIVLLERQVDAAKDRADKEQIVALYVRIAELRERLGQSDLALDAFHGVLDWDERNKTALRAAVRIHTERDDSLVLGDLFDRLLEVEEGDAAVDLALKVADLKLGLGDLTGAENALLIGFSRDARSAPIKRRLTDLYEERGDRVGLARLSAKEARYIASPAARRDVLLQAAETISREGDSGEAADLYEEVFNFDTSDREVLFSFMEACSASRQQERAITVLEKVLEKDPDDAWLLFSRAVLREAVGDSEGALQDLDAAYTKSGQYAAEYKSHLDAAILRASESGRGTPRETELRLRLAEVHAALGDIDGAREAALALLERSPKEVLGLSTAARIEEHAGNLEAAAGFYARMVDVVSGGELTKSALYLYDLSQRIERPEFARAGLERALLSEPDNVELGAALRSTYEELGAIFELAELLVSEAHRSSGEEDRFERLLQASRLLLFGTGDSTAGPQMAERAYELLEEARTIRAADQDVLQLLSEALGSLGRGDEAREVLAPIIASHKGRRSRELGQVYYCLYRVEAKAGALTEALEALTKAFDCQPQHGGIALELGQLAVDLDDQDVAQRAFRAVTLMRVDQQNGITAPERAIAYYHLGSIAARQGDARRARLMLEKSLAEDPTLDAARELLASIETP